MTGLVLAAGAGRRFGRPKALVEFRGVRLVDHAVALLRAGGCDRVVVVSGAVALAVPGAEVVHNERWESGMGSSLRTGLTAIGRADVVVIPVDMPWLGAEAVRRVAGADASLAVATYGGARRHPVFLGAQHLPGVIDSAVGDAGARHYLRAHSDRVVEVPCDDTGSPRDVDVSADLHRAEGSGPGGH
ncbi:nucleotidyltransferase family protein [Rhodococcus sp. IEGM 1408]|uniref:nucleotidyltransferase family protein n=1 Tax=Rhodococcus sp. IEGM 1408 TaxID=3082220 RepID=UPI002955AB55|nr:nucleotidyltransferase family protein [Rhodococcus sp. IEGM 1408]MDV8000679.1 nucleotidyltransferase family protein [Rhodococcus sp. IEGM 1408]